MKRGRKVLEKNFVEWNEGDEEYMQRLVVDSPLKSTVAKETQARSIAEMRRMVLEMSSRQLNSDEERVVVQLHTQIGKALERLQILSVEEKEESL